MMDSASREDCGAYLASESRMKTWPHSVHSFSAASSFCSTVGVTSITSASAVSAISESAATEFATTVGFESLMRSRSWSMKPRSCTSSGLMS